MARRIIRGRKSPGAAPERMPQPTRTESSGFLGLGNKQVPYETPEYLESERQYQQWKRAEDAYQEAVENNRNVGRRTQLLNQTGVPQFLRNDLTRGIADGVVDGSYQRIADETMKRATQAAPYALAAGGAVLGGVGAANLAKAYYSNESDGLSTDPLSVIGRSIAELDPGSVGTDPLAAARLNVQAAQREVGSDAVLAAVVDDQLTKQAAAGIAQQQFDQQVSALVDARAAELQRTPIPRSDGSLAPMSYDSAVRLAQEEVALQLRADGII